MAKFRPVDPKQSFPALEEGVLKRWREHDVFARSLAARENGETWSFYEGPPTANGKPHSGHVLSRVFKDIYPRYRTMRGYSVPRKAGWDCHGLPVELEVERQLGISSKAEIEEYGIAEFNQRCRESVFEYVSDWNSLTERIGFWIDLDDPYVTLDNDYIESVWWALRRIWDDDRLYRGHRVVPYCPRCGTALSSHEVALGYKDVEDPSVYVRLAVAEQESGDPAVPGREAEETAGIGSGESPLQKGDQLLVWTTTPWTLISNAAVAAGKEIEYVRVQAPGSDEVLVLAAARVEHVLGEGAEILAHFPGEALSGTRYEPPFDYIGDFGPRGHTVLLGDFVTTEDGTGLVHTAIAFGEDDFRLGEQYGLRLQNPVREDGTFDERVPEYEGRSVKDADPEIVEALRESGRLLRAETYEHAYPHCWRCETPLIYYAKSSWYVRTTDVRDRMLAENESITWQPEHIRDGRFGQWLANNQDWALSRERYWGTPLPIWQCTADGCDSSFCAGAISDLRERGGEVPDDLHRPYVDDVVLSCERCGGEMRRVADTIDAWFDSGAMPFAQFHYPFENRELFEERFPAAFISEAIDQTRGWFYSLLAVSTLLFDRSSYEACVCLGLILDPEGQKMSKSRGNVVDPGSVIDSHGADAFRWYYFTAQQPWAGYRFSIETLGETVSSFFTTLWNTYSFWVMYANAEGIEPGDELPLPPPTSDPDIPGREAEEMSGNVLDQWVLSELQHLTDDVIADLDAFECTRAGRRIAEFVDRLSNWYVRLGRRRFWEGDRAAFGTLGHCLVQVAKLLAPYVPFIADEIHANLTAGADPGFDGSVHLEDFPEPDEARRDPQLEERVGATLRVVELGRAARAQAKVKVRQPLAKAVVVAAGSEREAIGAMADLVCSELNVKELEFVESDAELVSYEVKPNYRTLGPRFGKEMPSVAAAVSSLDPAKIAAAIDEGRPFGISIGGHDHELTADDVTLAMAPLEGYEVEAEAGRAVALALELDEDLRREGLAREIVHAVQNARREAGLEITDRIALILGGDEELLEAARQHHDYLAGETLATSVEYDGASGATIAVEGRDLRVEVAKA